MAALLGSRELCELLSNETYHKHTQHSTRLVNKWSPSGRSTRMTRGFQSCV